MKTFYPKLADTIVNDRVWKIIGLENIPNKHIHHGESGSTEEYRLYAIHFEMMGAKTEVACSETGESALSKHGTLKFITTPGNCTLSK